MGYYGNELNSVTLAPQVFTGAGSATFVLNPRISSAQVFVNKILQVGNYAITGNSLVFDAVVAIGAEVVVIPRAPVGRNDVTNYRLATADQTGSSTTAYTATYTPANAALSHNSILGLKVLYANTTTTPTFSPDGLTAKTIVNSNGDALSVGQLSVGMTPLLKYDSAYDEWWLVAGGSGAGSITARSSISGPSFTFGTELSNTASFTYSMTANTTLTAPLTANLPPSGAWYIDITVDSTGGYTLTFSNSASVNWNQVYGFSFDCLPNGVYRLWMVARGATIIDVSVERLV